MLHIVDSNAEGIEVDIHLEVHILVVQTLSLFPPVQLRDGLYPPRVR